MITLSMIFAISIIFFILGSVIKIIFGLLKFCFWPVKAIFGFLFSIIGIILLATFGFVFIIPLVLFLIGWLVSRAFCII